MKILVVDNYDSFVYNIVHLLYEIGVEDIDVIKNDQLDFSTINEYDKIVLSPGPGIPKDAGTQLINLKEPLHGIASEIEILKDDYLFQNLPVNFKVGHYHSWVVSLSISDDIEVLAKDAFGNIMALKHKEFDIRGLQFHPESILTENGKTILTNWINHAL